MDGTMYTGYVVRARPSCVRLTATFVKMTTMYQNLQNAMVMFRMGPPAAV